MSNLNKEIQASYPIWIATDEYTKIDYGAITTIAYSFASVNGDGSLYKDSGYNPSDLIAYAHARGVKVILSFQQRTTNDIDVLLSNPANQIVLINNLINEMTTYNFDGVENDLEWANTINTIIGGPNKPLLTAFQINLYNTFKAKNANYHMVVALPSHDWNDIWDISTIKDYTDFMLIMGYDFYGSWSSIAGPNAPIDLDNISDHSIRKSIQYYESLVPKNKLLLGTPWYGYEFATVSNARLATRSTNGSVTGMDYKDYINVVNNYTIYRDSVWKTPWYTRQIGGQWYQGHYDDVTSLGIKYDLVNSEGIAGIGIWNVGCGADRSELWQLIRKKFVSIPVICSIKVTSPLAGVIYKVRKSRIIRWTSTGNVGTNVNIQLLRSGIIVKTISTDTANDGSFSWIVPSVSRGNDYQIKITSKTNNLCSGISGKFTIK